MLPSPGIKSESKPVGNRTSHSESGVIQRKLQRAYQEKELLLGEVQTLRQQLRSFKDQDKLKSTTAPVEVAEANMEGWNHLLEANMKSGTLACVWCIKAYYIKMIAVAFGKWKCFSACAFALSSSGKRSHAVTDQSVDARMKRLCTFAGFVLSCFDNCYYFVCPLPSYSIKLVHLLTREPLITTHLPSSL
jgi:hypothetical protein